ncbi:tautomerase family protein [Methylobacterium sp. HMF5984]|uniref:tautomerase family protein n=1 Tax=Methylobacterium sp. HMF5984 TaxID=3367370 RepID=UPI003851B5C1
MPLTRISLRAGKSPAYHAALVAGLYAAMREAFAVPENDLFTVIHEHGSSAFAYDPGYLGTARDDDLVMIQITANDTRDTAQKRALYAAIARNLGRDPGVKPGNVLVNLVEVARENWSFGDGLMQYGPTA